MKYFCQYIWTLSIKKMSDSIVYYAKFFNIFIMRVSVTQLFFSQNLKKIHIIGNHMSIFNLYWPETIVLSTKNVNKITNCNTCISFKFFWMSFLFIICFICHHRNLIGPLHVEKKAVFISFDGTFKIIPLPYSPLSYL